MACRREHLRREAETTQQHRGRPDHCLQLRPRGQFKKVTLPDTSWVGYDDAHRRVAVYDNKGNRTDPSGI